MALTIYQTQTNALLQNPAATTPLYDLTSITRWINSARAQIAGETECIRYLGSQPTVSGTASYSFSAINTGSSATNGIGGVLNVRQIGKALPNGNLRALNAWPWEWFFQYYYAAEGVTNATPTEWSLSIQGVAGVYYLSPTPDAIYVLTADSVCYPIDLVNDATVEAISYPWTDCIPYFAAYLALLSSQTSARMADAERMFALYEKFRDRARRIVTASVLPFQYEQSGMVIPVPVTGAQLPTAGGQ